MSTEQNLLHRVASGVSIETRTLYISGVVDDELAHRTLVSIEALDRTDGDIRIVLNSEGGGESPGYAIYDAITMCRNKVVTDGYGSVMSIAAAIFQAADLRRMAPNAEFMVHNGSIDGADGSMQQSAVIDLAELIKRRNTRYYDILAHGSQQPVDVIQAWCHDETFFNAQETLAAGFCDEIIQPIKQRVPLKKKRARKKT